MPKIIEVRFLILISTLLYILQPIYACSNPSVEENIKTKLLEIQYDSALEPDLLETLLMVSKHWQPNLNTATLKAEIRKRVLSARDKLKGIQKPEEIVRALRTVLHEEGGYQYTDQVDETGVPTNSEELFLHGLLENHKGYCMNLSLLYLILGQKLGLPLYGVALPNHFFVRYEQKEAKINIESTEAGIAYPDSFYQQRFAMLRKDKNQYFMKNLDTRQTLGAYFSNVGMVYYRSQKPERAVFYLKLSTTINPLSIDAQNNLANIFAELNQPQKAIQHYELALKADPENTSTLFNLGLALQDSSAVNKAIKAFLQVVQMDPGFNPAHQMLANIYRQLNRPIAALLHLQILLRSQPENVRNHLNIASTYQGMGQHKLAIETLAKIKNQFPENSEIRAGLAESYYRIEDFDNTIAQYRFLIDQDQTQLRNYIQLGWTYYRLHDLPMASAWTLRGMKKSQETGRFRALAQMNLGFYLLLQKQYNPARKWYEKTLAENSAQITQGMIQDIQEAFASDSGRTDLEFFKGWIYFKARLAEKSRIHLQSYLQIEQNGLFSDEARNLLKQLSSKIKDISHKIETPVEKGPPKDMSQIPAGIFIMGSNSTLADEAPAHRVYLDSYWIDKYEVSAEQFSEFLNAKNNRKGYYLDNKIGTLIYSDRYRPRTGLENFPINNVNWSAANDYCRWKGKRLPTEAQWEKAARGTSGYQYPWGNTPATGKLARYSQVWTDEEKHQVMLPVQSLTEGQSPYGLHNMAGNVKEWVDDWYDHEYYKEQSEYANPEGPIGGEFKVIRGGSWRDMKGFIYSSFRNSGSPKSRMEDYGFRCAISVTPKTEEKKLTHRVVPRNKG